MMRLKDKVAIVTGAGSGIGKSISENFAREGAKGVVSSLRVSDAQCVADSIISNAGQAFAMQCDVSVKKDVQKTVAKAVEMYGR